MSKRRNKRAFGELRNVVLSDLKVRIKTFLWASFLPSSKKENTTEINFAPFTMQKSWNIYLYKFCRQKLILRKYHSIPRLFLVLWLSKINVHFLFEMFGDNFNKNKKSWQNQSWAINVGLGSKSNICWLPDFFEFNIKTNTCFTLKS